MLTWRGLALGMCVCAGMVAACGDDPARRRVADSEAGAAGQASEPGSAGVGAGAGAAPGGSGAGGEAGAAAQARVDLASYCQAVGEGYSAWLSFCYGTDAYPEDEAAAFAANTETRCLQVAPDVAAGRMAFDELAAAACVDSIDTGNCDGFDFIEGKPQCRAVFSGQVEVGGECYWGATHFSAGGGQCANGYCDNSGQACPGECVAFKEDEQACSSSAECLPDSWCASEVCTPRPGLGEPCSADACPFGSSCITPPDETEGVCVARSEAGQACDESEPCSFGFHCLGGECHSKVATGEPCLHRWNCADGERCVDRDGDGPTCGGPGGHDVPCASADDCVSDHYCSSVAPRVCAPRIAVGVTCEMEGQCAVGAWCNLESGECQAGGGLGDSCLMNGFPAGASDACQGELVCMTNGECQPVGGEGDPCNTMNVESCEPGLYCSRVDFTCQPPAAEAEPCNPYSPVTCADDLACLCDDPACESYGGDPRVSDALHTCLPRRADGDPCFSSYECEVGSSCVGSLETTCVPDPMPCSSE